jgi:superfamily II DNA or RNA helicase
MSIVLYLQQIGRALRYSPGKKHAVLIDAVGNVWRHGPPWIAREWTLTGNRNKTENGQTALQIARCAVCFGCYDPKREVCPFCGAGKENKQRMIKTVDGSLKLLYNDEIEEIEREAARVESERLAEIDRKNDVRGQVSAAKTRDELERIARDNKYKPGWVYYWCRLKRIAV